MWMVGLRWSVKLLGLINTMILARLLVPADFGLVAMAVIVVGLVDVVFEFGTDLALIQKTDATKAHFNAAWSIRILQGTGAAVFIAMLAPLAALFYDDPRVVPLLLILAPGVFIRGFTNIGVVSFRKELNFAREFQYQIVAKILGVVITISLALWLRDYRALILGTLANYALEVILSYVMHPFRPRFSLQAGAEIWSFSRWVIALSMARYLASKVDRVILGSLISAHHLGLYVMGGEIGRLPMGQIAGPISRSLVPGFAKLKEEPGRLDAAFLKTLGATVMVGVPASVGLIVVADELVPIMLGEQWYAAIPFVKVLAIMAMFHAVATTSVNLLTVTGEIRWVTLNAVLRACAFLILIYPVFSLFSVIGVAWLNVIIQVLGVLFTAHVIVLTRAIPMGKLFAQVWRPLSSAAVMAGAVTFLEPLWSGNIFLAFMGKVSVGAICYASVLPALWLASGRPSGIEKEILERVSTRLTRSWNP